MQSKELDEWGTVRVLIALLEQADVDLQSVFKQERDSAINFFESRAFDAIALVFRLNEKRIRRVARETYEFYEQNSGTKNSKKRKRQPASQKYQLGEVWGKLRLDLQEGGQEC